MKLKSECIPCLLGRVLYEANLVTSDETLKMEALLGACKTLIENYDPVFSSAEIATKVHKTAYKILGTKDPYKKLKEESNRLALQLLPKIKSIIENSEDHLKTSMLCAIIGNILDFGIRGSESDPSVLIEKFDKYFSEGLKYDDSSKVKELLKDAKNIVFVTDNCGEIVFDKLLCQEIKKFNNRLKITLVVRGEPILTDATMEDVLKIGFDEVVDKILTTGAFAVGLNIKKIPADLKKTLKNSDLIICKGMANYEAFSETNYKPIAYLLRTKCTAIADDMKLPLNINAIKLYY
ncbi:MAG: DUF89 family protein [Thermoplasmata archaeon]|nr:DUF89 family protein [Thermoplasmata archaeon]